MSPPPSAARPALQQRLAHPLRFGQEGGGGLGAATRAGCQTSGLHIGQRGPRLQTVDIGTPTPLPPLPTQSVSAA
eukprot:15300867-Alexandrium_andersonii.AAC.1